MSDKEALKHAELHQKLGLPADTIPQKLLRQALTHKSVTSDRHTQDKLHNERLEYLGDAFLKSSISEWLFQHMPEASEGQMSQIRSYVVSDAALAKVAQRLHLARYILVGDSERGGPVRESIQANVMESLCGAIFLSTDFRTTARIILRLLSPELMLAVQGEAEEVLNYKALLQEYAQGQYKSLPVYTLKAEVGPDHDRTFSVQVSLRDQLLGEGSGSSKKRAEQEAARQVLEQLDLLKKGTEPMPEAAARFFAEQVRSQNAAVDTPEASPQPQKLLLAPSILSADFACLAEAVQSIHRGGAPWVHLDVMDGHFVPNLTFGPPVIAALRRHTPAVFDAHLMIEQPERYIEAFAQSGCQRISVHYETCPHLDRVLSQIAEAGALPGVSLNPATPVSVLEDILHKLHLVLIMSVNPGFGGQTFIPRALQRIAQVREMRARQQLEQQVLIQVDGGINAQTLPQVVAAGADVFVMGSAIFGADGAEQNTQSYQKQLYLLEQSRI